ncbi:MAG: hypothetical protein IJE06_02245, partial [Alistipes sp.]|nr:hypothetical protein [Alistipes sp.]
YTQAEPLLSWLEEPAVPVMFISHPKPLPLIREGLVASVPLASYALGIMGKLGIVGNSCAICNVLIRCVPIYP